MRKWFLNKYLITLVAFMVWMTFFDRNNFIYQQENLAQLKAIEQEKEYYLNQIKENEEALQELLTNQVTLEKFAREKYLMKKDNEEIFVIIKEEKPIEKTYWERLKEKFHSLLG